MIALKKFKKFSGPVVAAALLTACATATPYQPLGYPGERGGYVDQQIDATHWRVSFFGNTLTSRQQVETYLMYRTAELTLQQGYNCFTVINRDTQRDTRLRAMPYGPGGYGYGYGGGFYRGWSPYWNVHGPWGWHSYDPWYGDGFWGRYDIDTIDRYEATADVALSRGQCSTTPGTFDAQQVVQNLHQYIVPPRPR